MNRITTDHPSDNIETMCPGRTRPSQASSAIQHTPGRFCCQMPAYKAGQTVPAAGTPPEPRETEEEEST